MADMPVSAPIAPPRRRAGDARQQDRFAAIHALQQSGWSVSGSDALSLRAGVPRRSRMALPPGALLVLPNNR